MSDLLAQAEAMHQRLMSCGERKLVDHVTVLKDLMGVSPFLALEAMTTFRLGLTYAVRVRPVRGESGAGSWEEQPTGEPVYTLPVVDELGYVVDLLALGERFTALKFNTVTVLGEPALRAAREVEGRGVAPLLVHRRVLDWLASWCGLYGREAARPWHDHGICIIDRRTDLEQLCWGFQHLAAGTPQDAVWLQGALEANRRARRAREPALPAVYVRAADPEPAADAGESGMERAA